MVWGKALRSMLLEQVSVMRGLMDQLSMALGKRPFSFQLRLLTMVTAVPLLLLSSIIYQRMVYEDRENTRQGLLTNARTLAALVDNEIATHAAIASTLGNSPALRSGNLAAFWDEARKSLEFVPGAWLTVSRPDGTMLLATLRPLGTTLPQHAAPKLIERAFAAGHFQVSDLILAAASQRLAVLIEVPVIEGGKPLYSLSIAVPPESFLRLLENQFGKKYVVAIIDRQFTFVARTPGHAERVGTLAAPGWRDAIARAPEGWSENLSVDGNPILTGHAPTAHGWTVGVAQRESDLVASQNRLLWSTALVGGILIASSLALTWWLSSLASRSMGVLAEAARAVGTRFQPIEFTPPFAEARVIADHLTTAAEELYRRGEKLAQVNIQLEQQVAERTSALVTEMRRREEIEGTLRQTQKMEAIGQLTGGIAHDFNNMLTVIIGNLDTLQRRLRAPDAIHPAQLAKPIEAATQGARNAAKLTHRLLAFARQQPLAPQSVDLRAVVSGMGELMARTVGETIKIETVSGAGLWPTLADVNQIENALLNLVVNARDAMPNGGLITIETSNAYLDEAYVAPFGDISTGQYVMLSVSDSGCGIPAEKLDKVFEPFYTTKPPGQGTGLGLAMIHGFVKQSGGHIRIYSEVGQGTTVKIYLPRLTSALPVGPASPVEEKPQSRAFGGEMILVVEDDDGVRAYVVDTLEDLGYQVQAASDAEAALRVLSGAGRIDLLFTDVVLSGALNGRQLADEAKRLRPELPVLFTTGYTRNAIVHHGRLDAGVNLLSKPYASRELGEQVRRIIDTVRGPVVPEKIA